MYHRTTNPQASALLYGDPYDFYLLNGPDTLADYFREYY